MTFKEETFIYPISLEIMVACEVETWKRNILNTVVLCLFRYSTDYGMFRFCIADTEHDWREGSEQYDFIEKCFASVDRQKWPWLIFLAHRVLGYSSATWYTDEGSFAEPMGRESLQKLWQKYKVDITMYGHVHNYERICPFYQVWCSYMQQWISSFTSIHHS